MVIFMALLLVAVASWGQYWYDRAKSLREAITYMVAEEEIGKQQETDE